MTSASTASAPHATAPAGVPGRRRVSLIGSTGSIGTQGLEVIAAAPGRFEVAALAGGANTALLARQAVATGARAVGSATATVDELAAAIAAAAAAAGVPAPEPVLFSGPGAARDVAAWPDADVVLNGITGSIGLGPTLAALEAGHLLALANKESLIVGGALVRAAAAPGQLVPVDSEHSALAQALRSGTAEEVRRLVLTASGGPFRGRTREQLHAVTPAEALAHPTWDMGRVVTTNSASMVNKALEVIEAHLLFDVPLERIDVVVHPQSVVHSMVEFADGSTIAQASPPDMRLPIALGLGWPHRVPGAAPACDWTRAATWTFEPLDEEAFPAVALAKQAAAASPTHMAVFNAANEEAVEAFHAGAIGFPGIVDTVRAVVGDYDPDRVLGGRELSVAALGAAEDWARSAARSRWTGGR
ncbi:1-deoxy-D-xylulose-5-phosphate reductoisomerase [Citricoccus sp. SGAir0253]|uniref:1-deoxy-D-xylulose-5-phosphate reductoisomerase n=1 Tax=Citricoccus sp. SGAir0253 TaxID=2567881 RepID=UPI0010CCD14E|nr:1-deoxy-D-xylulose-5-phosphate reductoisomerase [Citricoccus sp. SGAir0253]QCU78534.1 1-deoxy-D-xylulose-5-phosphate reductoisomerase [Citricoccus sp. SGAir0253]